MILHLPVGPRGEDGLPGKQGPDDFIVRYGEQAFRDFIESSINHRPVVRTLVEYRAEMVSSRLDSIAHPGIYCDRSPAGSGKSYADRPTAAVAGSSLTVLPTHRNCTEVADTYVRDGLDAAAYPQLTREMCADYDNAIRAIESGLSPSTALCPICFAKASCAYQEGMEEADAAARRSVVAVWQTKIPDHAATWFCDATADADDLQAILGRPVCDRTPAGDLQPQHQAVQVTSDIKKSTAPSTLLKVLRGILAAFPEAMRGGIIAHQEHLPIIRGTAKVPEHRLDESLRHRIAKAEYFRSGEGRGSNHWIDECDLLVVVGTPRVPPPAVKLRLIQVGMVLAAARDGRWEPDYWSGITTTGKHVTVRTSAYRDHDWYAANRSIVRAELIQAIGRGRGICEKGIPVVVLSNEPLGLPILEIDVHPLSDTAARVIQAIRQLSEQNPKGESPLDQQASYRNKTLNNNTLEFCSVSSSQLATALGLTDRRVRYVLDDLAERGFVQRIGQRSGWTLTPKGESFLSTSPITEEPGAAAAAGPGRRARGPAAIGKPASGQGEDKERHGPERGP